MENQKKSTKKVIGISLLVIIVLEVFLFNFKAFRLCLGKYSYQKYTPEEMTFSGLTYIKEWDEYVANSETPFIEIEGIDREIATIKLNLEILATIGKQDSLDKTLPVQIDYTDEGGEYYRYFPQKVVVSTVESSKYIACYTCGSNSKIKLNFPTQNYFETGNTVVEDMHNQVYLCRMKVDSVEINVPIPFHFSIIRVASLWMIVMFIYVSLNFFKKPYDASFTTRLSDVQNLVLIVTVIIFIVLANTSVAFYPQGDLYADYYTNAILNKQLAIDYPVSEELLSLKNPYDESERTNRSFLNLKERDAQFLSFLSQYQIDGENQDNLLNVLDGFYGKEALLSEKESYFLLDASYYQGKYYAYFGIIPLLLFYVPFTYFTKVYLPHKIIVSLANGIIIWLLYKMLLYIYEKHFSKLPFWILWHSLILILFGSMVVLMGNRPLFYEVSISMGIMFSIYGIYQLLQIDYEGEIKKQDSKRMVKAAISYALAVGCRPTYFVFLISLLPYCYTKIWKNKQNSTREKVWLLCKMCIPIVGMAVFLMYLNYVRFGSAFEFGMHYQLTVKNNANMPYRYITIFPILWKYIFGVPHFTSQFPFYELQGSSSVTYYAYTYVDSFFGGIFFMTPITLFLWKMRKLRGVQDQSLKKNILSLGIIAIVLLFFSASLSSLELRYFADFSWIFTLISILIMWQLYMSLESEEGRAMMGKLIVFITVVTIIIGLVVQKCVRSRRST